MADKGFEPQPLGFDVDLVWGWSRVYIQGFEWSDSYQACVDIDECSTGSAACGDNKVCTGVHCGAF